MAEEVPAAYIKNVQDSLSKYVKRPPLNEKLLRKPPFRYLHDIVNVIIKETNFLHNVYTAEELDSNNVKDKESKIRFLEKLIAAVKTASGKKVTARPSKIVAGLEVIKTLELLQALGEAIDADNASGQEISNETQNTELQREEETKVIEKIKKSTIKDVQNNSIEKNMELKIRNKESTKLLSKMHGTSVSDNTNNKKRTSVTKVRESLEKESAKESLPNKVKVIKISKDVNNSIEKGKTTKKNISATKQIQNKLTPTRKSSLKENKGSNIVNSIKNSSSLMTEQNGLRSDKEPQKSENVKNINDENKSTELVENDSCVEVKNESDRTKQISTEDLNMTKSSEIENEMLKEQKRDALVESTMKKESVTSKRPTSARPGTRRSLHNDVKSKAVADERAVNLNSEKNNMELRNQNYIRPRTATRPPSARPGAPRIKDRGEVQVSEEDVTIPKPVNVIEEGKQDQFGNDKESFIIMEPEQNPIPLAEPIEVNEAEQGQLVHQILKTQKELNESVTGDVVQNKHLEIEWEAGRQCGRDIILKEIEMIRSSIQSLTSAANPLGKLFDFLQEDIEEMQRELQHWKGVNEKLQQQKPVELELGKLLLKPLMKQLIDVENNIQDELVQIANVKVAILTNDERILKLVSGTGPSNKSGVISP